MDSLKILKVESRWKGVIEARTIECCSRPGSTVCYDEYFGGATRIGQPCEVDQGSRRDWQNCYKGVAVSNNVPVLKCNMGGGWYH